MTDLADVYPRLPEPLAARTRRLGPRPEGKPAFVVYWMRTAVRAHENPALDVALWLGAQLGVGVFVQHGLSERYPYASDRHHTFILQGARDVREQLRARGVGYAFHLEREGHRGPVLVELARAAGVVVTEDMPVPPLTGWTGALARRAEVPVLLVDTACVAPMKATRSAPKRAFAFRKATQPLWDAALRAPWREQPDPPRPFVPDLPYAPTDLDAPLPRLVAECDVDHLVGPVPDTPGGTTAGYARWDAFRERGLRRYAKDRNDPNRASVSRMSAYLHYGMVSPLRLAREAHAAGADKYLDELLTWRELAHCWCFHQDDPGALEALPGWAQETLAEHAGDAREPRSWETLARARSGVPLWDAAQRSLLVHGELHNNVRMTWGKAIPGWTESPARALETLIDLNHRYALDGRDPASYGGLLWCLGLFDRPFEETPILGKVRGRSIAHHASRLDVARYATEMSRPFAADPPRVAVIGAGIAGLVCARALADHGLKVTVFEKARGPGGRTSTRRRDAARFDHGAQYFTARDPVFARYVESWARDGVVAPWDARFVTLKGGDVIPDERDAPRWVATPTMSALAAHLASDLQVRYETRVTAIHRDGSLESDGGELGRFDQVLVSAPAPQAAALLADTPLAARLERIRLAPCWAVMLRLAEPLDPGWDAARVEGASLSWIARDASKPGRGGAETWVAHGSPEHAAAHLEGAPEAIARALEDEFRSLTGAPPALEAIAHRWRHARVIEALGEPCLLDAELGRGACGDGFLGAKIEAAFRSGAALAGRVLGEIGKRSDAERPSA